MDLNLSVKIPVVSVLSMVSKTRILIAPLLVFISLIQGQVGEA